MYNPQKLKMPMGWYSIIAQKTRFWAIVFLCYLCNPSDHFIDQSENSSAILWWFRNYSLSLQHRLLALGGEAGGLIVWERRFRTSVVVSCELRKLQSLQQTDDNRGVYVVRFYIPIYISSVLAWAHWRCLSCVERAVRRRTVPGWAEEQTPTPFLCFKLT